MDFCIDGEQLRKAVTAISAAEKNGFNFCLAVFRLSSAGIMLDSCRAEYSDLIEKAHPTSGDFDWGRFQGVSRRNRFVNGRLVPLSGNTAHTAVVQKTAPNKRVAARKARPKLSKRQLRHT